VGHWLFMLGGLIVWAVHFLGVYGIASAGEVLTRSDSPASLWTVGAFTAACLAADAALLAWALRRRTTGDTLDDFTRSLAALGAGVSAIAVLWQGFPALVGH
jgi:hypothetical protein